ncbi:hypothetical protein VC83_00592 [Pseudogymnoascus destructans]|uniref:Benzoate 4-monooxygenase cytochrome P450 n=1 Tax=Pseudogymnoascus destructans TaxID=655981 RepID=A0A177ALZ5_9PEZI|nr:uncharacterized protein VC83_00592 [Pseudogymnoascus destructans]OAF63087.1 hypothetical protein VC83_00592 [Pseudogymnoascus destructans]
MLALSYGKLVRIAPNHVSIADDSAIQPVYGHGNGFLESDYYDAFVFIQRSLFNTRNGAEHTRKRKTIAHTLYTKSISQFEEYMTSNLAAFTNSGTASLNAHMEGSTSLDALHWFNYLAFDIIADLVFWQPFRMVEKGKISLRSVKHQILQLPTPQLSKSSTVAAKTLQKWQLPESQHASTDCVDLLARLMEGKDETGAKLGRAELTAEALTQLIAGSDTTSKTSCALLYWVLKTPGVLEKLQAELDAALPVGTVVPQYIQVRDLKYMQCVINQTLQIHLT